MQQNKKWALWCPVMCAYGEKSERYDNAFTVASLEDATLFNSLPEAAEALTLREHNDQPVMRRFMYPVPVIETITEEIKAAHYASEQVWSDVLNRYMTIEHFRPAVVEKKRTVRAASLEWK